MATADDVPGVHAIYAPIVAYTATSLETAPPTVDEMAARITRRQPMYPWLVATNGDAVEGYAYGGRFATRPGYDWSVEVSVYVAESTRGHGVGTALYRGLFAILESQGYRQLMAGINLPNAASVALHERMGFVQVGIYRHAGWKLGAWQDVGWWQRPLGTADGPPAAPAPFTSIIDAVPESG